MRTIRAPTIPLASFPVFPSSSLPVFEQFAALQPLKEAVEKISARTPIGSTLRTAEWAEVPLALRERAQFSAGVESVRLLQTIQERLEGEIRQQREKLDADTEAVFDRSSFIDSIRDIARDEGLEPTDPTKKGTIQDITSSRRLGLIYDMQTGFAQGFARWKLDQSEGALLLFPAQEFVRVEERNIPREDWPRRFAEAARDSGDDAAARAQAETGRMIALKNSPLWAKLSRFDVPWPPFDFGSGMGLEDVDRDEAIALGLLEPGQKLEGAEKDFNENLQSSVADLSDDSKSKLKEHFGDNVRFDGDAVWWRGDRKLKQLGRARLPPSLDQPEEPARQEPRPTAIQAPEKFRVIDAEIIRETEKAILIRRPGFEDAWLPKSQIQIAGQTITGPAWLEKKFQSLNVLLDERGFNIAGETEKAWKLHVDVLRPDGEPESKTIFVPKSQVRRVGDSIEIPRWLKAAKEAEHDFPLGWS